MAKVTVRRRHSAPGRGTGESGPTAADLAVVWLTALGLVGGAFLA